MAHIVFVHGIGHENRSPGSVDVLEMAWREHLAEGLRGAGFQGLADRLRRDEPSPDGITAQLAFYGDCFRRPNQMGLTPTDLNAEQGELARALVQAWLAAAANRAVRRRDRELASCELAYLEGISGEVQGSRAVMRSSLAGLARLRFFADAGMALAERLVLRSLAQVTSYLTEEHIRQTALERVADRLGPETKVMIGHSLGSVVAFEAAHQLVRPLPLLVTLGSPLGLRTIVYERLRPQPPTFPPQLLRWVNVADRDDIVAAEPNLTALFGADAHAGAIFEGGWTLDNGAHPHDAGFYLARRETGRPVGQTLAHGV